LILDTLKVNTDLKKKISGLRQNQINSCSRWMKKMLLAFLAITSALFFTMVIMVFAIAGPVPDGAENIIDEVLSRKLPEQIHGDTGRVVASDGLLLWYETITPSSEPKGTVLLIMGLGGNALEWPLYFVNPIVEAGYQVIRFDNRGTGLSSYGGGRYSIKDMAEDALSVLDHLDIDEAHIVGMSMGGMIAQVIAIDYPRRIKSLTLFMTSAYLDDPELPGLDMNKFVKFMATGIRYGVPRSQRSTLRSTISVRNVLAYDLSEKRIKTLVEQSLYNEKYRKGFSAKAFRQQTQALDNLPSRYDALKKLKIPSLVLHGKQDPLIPVQHGLKLAQIIPDAKLVLLEGMGHDVTPEHTKEIHDAMFNLMETIE